MSEGEIVSQDGDDLSAWRQDTAVYDLGAASRRQPVATVRMVEMEVYDPELAHEIARHIRG